MPMGLIIETKRNFAVDRPHGNRDFNGDMDFKVRETAKGITALFKMDCQGFGYFTTPV